MEPIAALLIVISVVFHATWNLIAKKSVMTISFYALLCQTNCVILCTGLLWLPVRYSSLPPAFWRTLVLTVSFDCLYGYGLSHAYWKLDMSSAYPVMRSLPLLLTMPLSVMLGGKALPLHAVIGMIIAFGGCLLMPLKRFRDFDWRFYVSADMLFILLAACGTTGYTLMDSRALSIMRESEPNLSKTVISIGYYVIRSIFLSSSLALCNLVNPADRRNYFALIRKYDWHIPLASISATFCYFTVLLAMNYVTNVTYVQMLRLLALPMGLLTGIFVLKEKGAPPKFAGVALILAGLILAAI